MIGLRLAVLVFLGLGIFPSYAQVAFVGIKSKLNLGSHEIGYGVGIHAGVQYAMAMLTVGSDVNFYHQSLGNRSNMWESRNYVGLSYVTKTQSGMGDFEFGTLRNVFGRGASFGYAYLLYFDNARTSQNSGMVRGEISGHAITMENDFFAGRGKDRFRTASCSYRYRTDFWACMLGMHLWTGETSGVQVQERLVDGQLESIKDLRFSPFGKTSHGILYGGVRYQLGNQSLGLELGYDSEQVRDVFQNKIAHARIWHAKNTKLAVTYPMLNNDGLHCNRAEDIRKVKPYFKITISGD